jgi:hypothetical protein
MQETPCRHNLQRERCPACGPSLERATRIASEPERYPRTIGVIADKIMADWDDEERILWHEGYMD